jgi:cutinase
VKVFCPKADGVCGGLLNVNLGHFSYLADGTIQQGYKFLAERAKAQSGGKGAAAAAAASEE